MRYGASATPDDAVQAGAGAGAGAEEAAAPGSGPSRQTGMTGPESAERTGGTPEPHDREKVMTEGRDERDLSWDVKRPLLETR